MVVQKTPNKSISRIGSGYSTRPTVTARYTNVTTVLNVTVATDRVLAEQIGYLAVTLQEIVHPWYKVMMIWWGLLVQNMILPPLVLQQ